MGMHFGVLAVARRWSEVAPALDVLAPRIDVHQSATEDPWAWLQQRTEQGFPLVGGEYGGHAYVPDSSWLLSGMAPDRLVALSNQLHCLVAGMGAETVSGSYYLVVADRGQPLRHYWSSHALLVKPYSRDVPLPSEADDPLEDLDGIGLRSALRAGV